jgi:hypothetical protein
LKSDRIPISEYRNIGILSEVPTSGIMDINICTPVNAFHPSMSSLSQSVGGKGEPAGRKPEEDPAIPSREGNWGNSRREAHAVLKRIRKG